MRTIADTNKTRRALTAMRMAPELLDSLDTYCKTHRLRPSRTKIIETAVREFLEKEGAFPPKSEVASAIAS